MVQIRPFAGWLVAEDFKLEVPTPAHDAMSGQQRRAFVETHASTYLRVERTVGDGVTDTASSAAVLDEGRAALEQLMAAGAFRPVERAMFVYRLETPDHSQTGVVAELSAADVLSGAVRPHEDVSPEKAHHLAEHFDQVGAQSSPILLGVRGTHGLAETLRRLTEGGPDLVVDAGDGVCQSVWIISDPREIEAIASSIAGEDAYVVDGHHRVAATSIHHRAHPNDEDAAWTLAVLYPTAELRVHEYNRIVSSLGGRTATETLTAIEHYATSVTVSVGDGVPDAVGVVSIRLGGTWYRVELPAAETDDVVYRLDPARVQAELLPRCFGIPADDPDSQVAHVGPNTGLDELAEQADRLGGAAIVLHPVLVSQILDVADAGRHMPRKSTYFAPKARSGVFLRQPPPAAPSA